MTEIEVNGKRHAVSAATETPLLYVLRNDLGLVGTRFGCGSGQCGACFVLVDGRAMASCDLPVSFVEGKKVTTIEGLENRHPVQKALVEEQAAQCGYCMSGIVMSAVALVDTNNKPSEAEIRSALDKNLCRCGSHNRVVRAILNAR
jgi:nicotinate dehydrogenase subunit A